MAWFSFRLAMLKIGSRFSATHLPRQQRAIERSLYRDAQILGQPFVIASTCESADFNRYYKLISAYAALYSAVMDDLPLLAPAVVAMTGRAVGSPRLKADEVAGDRLPFSGKAEICLSVGLGVEAAATADHETFSRQCPEVGEGVTRLRADLREGGSAVTHIQGAEHFIAARLGQHRERLISTTVVAHRGTHLSRGHRFRAV
jgi:hypothetical protein